MLLEGGEPTRAARYLALERQKQELRRERDRLMLDLARGLGPVGLAERLGVSPPAVAKLVEGARERLGSGLAERDLEAPQISARRLRNGDERWAEADAHYEALGRASSV